MTINRGSCHDGKLPGMTSENVLENLAGMIPDLSPQQAKAAAYMLENPGVIGVRSLREIAGSAGVKPNTLVRLARSLGFGGFDDLRAPFKDEIIDGPDKFPDRARRLQSLSRLEAGETCPDCR